MSIFNLVKIWTLIFFFCSALPGLARTDEYIIKDADDQDLGRLVVINTIKEDHEEILVKSEIKVKKLITVTISYSLHSIFYQNCLVQNDVITFRNRKPQDIMSTKRASEGYIFSKNSEERNVGDVPYSESMMYYNEPVNRSEIYSEFDGVFKTVKKTSEPNGYQLTNPLNNNESYYYYEDGILERAIVKHALISLYLYRK